MRNYFTLLFIALTFAAPLKAQQPIITLCFETDSITMVEASTESKVYHEKMDFRLCLYKNRFVKIESSAGNSEFPIVAFDNLTDYAVMVKTSDGRVIVVDTKEKSFSISRPDSKTFFIGEYKKASYEEE